MRYAKRPSFRAVTTIAAVVAAVVAIEVGALLALDLAHFIVDVLDLTITVGLVGVVAWLTAGNATANAQRQAESGERRQIVRQLARLRVDDRDTDVYDSALLREVRAIGPRVEAGIAEAAKASYNRGYLDGLGKEPPTPPGRRLHAVD
ncbi:hypothetical protein Val02_85280 [Virgisporangium aliadipatigenens]|uniref:Uncharacterized protein n=1 Tax=Virgisporangium aliadipatigenens TaxID=741659 RepID=A0A8J4DX18_9ACTN|nr:hypothetical protein [Virgisporangium aliadipatigenens]GIJ51642.1 hypothetical protein Val02_85280 [Virgisporangium aliadipatigenens]